MKRKNKKKWHANESKNVVKDTSDVVIQSITSPVESWILNSKVSFHCTIMKNNVSCDLFVHLANDKTLKIMNKGDIQVKLSTGNSWKLKT